MNTEYPEPHLDGAGRWIEFNLSRNLRDLQLLSNSRYQVSKDIRSESFPHGPYPISVNKHDNSIVQKKSEEENLTRSVNLSRF